MPHLAMWYRREDYDRRLAIMYDAEQFPSRFEEWGYTAWRQIDGIRSRGAVIQQIFLEPDQFLAFCEKKGLAKNGSGEQSTSLPFGGDEIVRNRSRINI